MKKAKIALGFNIYCENQLHYEAVEEKGRVKIPPLIQLGGGAWNMAKTFENLARNRVEPMVVAMTSRKETPQSAVVKFLLSRERVSVRLLPIKERMPSSFYLMPAGSKAWAFGDPGGMVVRVDPSTAVGLRRIAHQTGIRIVTEVSDDRGELMLTRMLLVKSRPGQVSVLLPSVKLLRSTAMHELLPLIDCLALNEAEAKIFFGKNPSERDLILAPVPFIFLTRGPKAAWFKVRDRVISSAPKIIKNPKFIAGAGDASLAALVLAYFIEHQSPEAALKFALRIGRATLLRPEPYFVA